MLWFLQYILSLFSNYSHNESRGGSRVDTSEKYKQKLKEDWEVLPNFFTTSSSKFIGRDEILDFIEKVNKNLVKS